MKYKLALCSIALVAAGNALACYTVYDASNTIVYNAKNAPVDMTKPLHETLPQVFPGGHMVFSEGAECPREQALPRVVAKPVNGVSPLLTDRATAQAMNAPHTVLASGAALIEQRPADMAPGVVVVTSGVVPTSAVAAAPLQAPDTATMGAGPAPQRYRSNVMITEMRNGATVVQTVPAR